MVLCEPGLGLLGVARPCHSVTKSGCDEGCQEKGKEALMRETRCLVLVWLAIVITTQVQAQRGHSIMVEGVAPAKGCNDTLTTEPNVIYNVLPGGGLVVATTVLRDVLGSIDPDLRVDALSYGRDFGYHKNDHSYFLFSVDLPAGVNAGGRSPAYCEPRSEVAGDLFWVADYQDQTTTPGTHGKASDENDASPVETTFPKNNSLQVEPCLGLAGTYGDPPRESESSHRITAFDYWPWTYDCNLYFSVNQTFVVGSETFAPGDILLLPRESTSATQIQRFCGHASLGLTSSDNVDAIALNLLGEEFVDNAFQSSFPPVLGTRSTRPAHTSQRLVVLQPTSSCTRLGRHRPHLTCTGPPSRWGLRSSPRVSTVASAASDTLTRRSSSRSRRSRESSKAR